MSLGTGPHLFLFHLILFVKCDAYIIYVSIRSIYDTVNGIVRNFTYKETLCRKFSDALLCLKSITVLCLAVNRYCRIPIISYFLSPLSARQLSFFQDAKCMIEISPEHLQPPFVSAPFSLRYRTASQLFFCLSQAVYRGRHG